MKKTLKISKLGELHSALSALDGYQKVVKEAAGAERVVNAAYTFAPDVRFSIAKNLAELSRVQETFVNAKNGLVREYAEGGNEVPKARMGDFNSALAKLLETEETCDLATFSYESLQTESNPIPPSVIASLMPMFGDGA